MVHQVEEFLLPLGLDVLVPPPGTVWYVWNIIQYLIPRRPLSSGRCSPPLFVGSPCIRDEPRSATRRCPVGMHAGDLRVEERDEEG